MSCRAFKRRQNPAPSIHRPRLQTENHSTAGWSGSFERGRAHWNPCVSPPCFHPFRECLAEQTFRDGAGGTNRDGPLPYAVTCGMAKRGPKQCPCLYRPNPAPQQKALLPNKDETETPHACGESQAEKRIHPCPAPRAWGRPVDFLTHLVAVGNTPTCVGKTALQCGRYSPGWKHPHVRGEANHFEVRGNEYRETPPRTWGRREMAPGVTMAFRNTPTRVGKPWPETFTESRVWTPPHARGETP